MNRLLKVSLGVVLAVLPLAASAQNVHWQARGGIDLSYRHFIIGYNVTVGLAKLGDGGFIGSTVANIVSAALFGGHPKNISAEISVGYQF